MGLGAPKRRNKLSHDPNNTAWTRSTDGYGHRILSSQGWKAGDYLGAEKASHADHYTAANASHIRVLLREDNLGLGAKVGGKGSAEKFGLSTLSDIFGRLNGKSDLDVEKQQNNLRDAKLRTYQSQKYGFMNFVRGGLLVGDKIEATPDQQADAKGTGFMALPKATKKRKAEKDAPGAEAELNRKRRSHVLDELVAGLDGNHATSETMPAKKSKKRERRQLAARGSENEKGTTKVEPVASGMDSVPEAQDSSNNGEKAAKRPRKEQRQARRVAAKDVEDVAADEKARLKQDKRARKEERRRRKEEKQLHPEGTGPGGGSEPSSDTTTTVRTAVPTPAISELPSGVSTPTLDSLKFGGNRHAVRQRYIMQKRMASMDPRALNEILMIKAQV